MKAAGSLLRGGSAALGRATIALALVFVALASAVPISLLLAGGRHPGTATALTLLQSKTRLLMATYGRGAAVTFLDCPDEFAYLTVFALLFLPVFAVVSSASGKAASVLEHEDEPGFVRVFCAFAESAGVVSLALLVLHLLAWSVAALYARPGVAGGAFPWLPFSWLLCAVYALPFSALGLLMRAAARGKIVSAALACSAVAVLSFVRAFSLVSGSRLSALLPNSADGLLLAFGIASSARGALLALGWTVILFSTTWVVIYRRKSP
jgi:hypothetical protein